MSYHQHIHQHYHHTLNPQQRQQYQQQQQQQYQESQQRQQHQQQYQQSQNPTSFYLNPSNIPQSSFSNSSSYPDTYFERLVKREPEAGSSSSLTASYSTAPYSVNSYESKFYSSNPGMSAAVALPPASAMDLGMMGYHPQARQSSLSVMPTPAQIPKQPSSPAYPQNNVPRTSRFQQLLNKKFAAEQSKQNGVPSSSSSSSSAQDSQDVVMGDEYLRMAQTQMIRQSSNTVFHKDFINTQYTPQDHQQQSFAIPTVKKEHDQQPIVMPEQPFFRNGQQRHPSSGSHDRNMPHPGHPIPQPQQQQQQGYPFAAPLPGNDMNVIAYPSSNSSSGTSQQRPVQWAGSYCNSENASYPVSSSDNYTIAQMPPTPASVIPNGQGNVDSSSWLQNAGMNGWVTSVAPTRTPVPAAKYQQHVSGPRSAPSFSWYVSQDKSTNGESSYHPQQRSFERTPALSPTGPYPPSINASSSSLPVTPTYPPQYTQTQANYTAPFMSVKIEPGTEHLGVPYTSHNQNISASSSPANAFSNAHLLDYGSKMFTNMNGSFSLPGPAMYMASTNGAGDSANLAEGMSENHGGAAPDGNGGDGWSNGNGNGEGSGSNGQDGSGSGSGDGHDEHGHGNGDGGRDDEEHDGGNGNTPGSSRKGKKLTLACHFCRRRKLKCNGVQPKCDNCTKRDEICSWDNNVRRRGPGKATKERREKAAREAAAAGLTNPDSLHPLPQLPDQEPMYQADDQSGYEHDHEELAGLARNLPIVDALSSLPDLPRDAEGLGAEGIHQFELDMTNHHPNEDIGNLPSGHINMEDGSLPLPDGIDDATLSSLHMDNNGNHNHMVEGDIPIDPTLAALSAAIPGTLAEMEQPNNRHIKTEKRKSDLGGGNENENGLNEIEAKRIKLDTNSFS